MNLLSEIAVVGTGAWGTALAAVIAGQGRNVVLVARDEARALEISTSRRSPHLPGILLPQNLHITGGGGSGSGHYTPVQPDAVSTCNNQPTAPARHQACHVLQRCRARHSSPFTRNC